MPGAEPWSLGVSLLAFAGSAAVLLLAGPRFTRIVDRLADRTGMGEALAGAVLLGATTSLPGLVVTGVAASEGRAELAVGNALGGIAAQTLFLAVADLGYRNANLEHAAASLPNLLQSMLLTAMIALVLLAATGPDLAIAGVHPISLVLPALYVYGMVLTRRTRENPMWQPKDTRETRCDEPEAENEDASLPRLLLGFSTLAALVALTGYVVARAGISLAAQTGLSGTIVGGLFTSVVTSLPELVTVIAAVRCGALTLAVGDIIGGNSFDVLFVSLGDLCYREGPIYVALGGPTLFLLALTTLLTAILAAGLVYRERRGIGFEGSAILVTYAFGFAALWWMR